jgi:hypothetical protein
LAAVIVLLLGILLFILLAFNFRGLRTATPGLRSGNILKAAGSWLGVIFIWLILIIALAPKVDDSTATTAGSMQTPIPAPTNAPLIAQAQPTATPEATATPKPTATAAPTAIPTSTPRPKDIDGAMADVMEAINKANQAGGMKFFLKAEITQAGARLNVTVSDDWYLLPDYQKERFLDTVGGTYAVIAAQHGLRGDKPDEANYPQTSFYDSYGKEVGYKSTWETKVYR